MKKKSTGLEPAYEEWAFDTALELLNELSPWVERWQRTGGIEQWWFRGQRDSRWKLETSSMRKQGFRLWERGTARPVKPLNATEQVKNEKRVVEEFIGACLKSGLPIPEDSQWFRAYDPRVLPFREAAVQELGVAWPPALERSRYALAQHHRVPTRLLDWSQLPFVAAYFACEEVARFPIPKGKRTRAGRSKLNGRCAIFALRKEAAFNLLRDPYISLEPVTAPYEANPNLRAQQGAFTLVVYWESTKVMHPLPTIEALVEDALREMPGEPALQDLLVKFTLPHAECRTLLLLLAQANVHAGTVFPNYDGVVNALKEREWWYA